jgi:hypothetical protein
MPCAANWPCIKPVWTLGILAALALTWLVHREWATGLGLAPLFLLGCLFSVDAFAERRAEIQTRALEALQATGVD